VKTVAPHTKARPALAQDPSVTGVIAECDRDH
jgi:hypothetical protein